MALLGYMGRCDGAPKGLGGVLIVDAARRAHRQTDIPARGLALEPEGGRANVKLWQWYQDAGFKPAKTLELMYAPYENLMPELKK